MFFRDWKLRDRNERSAGLPIGKIRTICRLVEKRRLTAETLKQIVPSEDPKTLLQRLIKENVLSQKGRGPYAWYELGWNARGLPDCKLEQPLTRDRAIELLRKCSKEIEAWNNEARFEECVETAYVAGDYFLEPKPILPLEIFIHLANHSDLQMNKVFIRRAEVYGPFLEGHALFDIQARIKQLSRAIVVDHYDERRSRHDYHGQFYNLMPTISIDEMVALPFKKKIR
jgi:hypothetical protein